MKLGEALRLRSDNIKKIQALAERAKVNAKTQEGAATAETPADLIAEIERLAVHTLLLIQRVNRTNHATALKSGQNLADALAERQHLLRLRAPYVGLADAASEANQRYLRSEIRMVRTVEPRDLRKRADDLSQRHRELDAIIQESNWTTELLA